MDFSSLDFSKIKQLVDNATNDMFFQPDWTLNLSIVDMVNHSPSTSEMVVHALKSRLLETKEEIVIKLCMDLYEALIKNCESVIPYFGRREFQETLVKIAMETQSFRAKDKILDIVQFLSDGLSERSDLFYAQSYKVLLYHYKVKFPPKRDETFIPPKKIEKKPSQFSNPNIIETQNLQKSSSVHQSILNDPFGIGQDFGVSTPTYESIPKESRSSTSSHRHDESTNGVYKQIEAAKTNFTLLLDLLDNTPPGKELKNNELVNEVLNECRTLRKSFLKMIEECSLINNEKLLDAVLRMNDNLYEAINEHGKALKGERVARTRIQKKKSTKQVKKREKKKKSDVVDEFAILASRKRPDDQINQKQTINNNQKDNIFLSNNQPTMFQTTNQFDFMSSGNVHSSPQLLQQQPQQKPSIDLFSFQDQPSKPLYNDNHQILQPLNVSSPPTSNYGQTSPFHQSYSQSSLNTDRKSVV